jgi:hypothetical protein
MLIKITFFEIIKIFRCKICKISNIKQIEVKPFMLWSCKREDKRKMFLIDNEQVTFFDFLQALSFYIQKIKYGIINT